MTTMMMTENWGSTRTTTMTMTNRVSTIITTTTNMIATNEVSARNPVCRNHMTMTMMMTMVVTVDTHKTA